MATKAVYLGVTCLFTFTSPNTNNTNNAWRLNSNGNINNNNNCNNSNGSRPALMVRSDRVGPKPKAAPSITSKEVTSSLDTKANTLRRCTPPHTEAAGCCWSCPCGTYTAHKEREAPAFVDKVVQHALVDNLIYERITNSFILDNYASQKGKGLHFGLDRLRGFFTEYWNKYRTAEGWVLKADVRHFFASIDHDKLKEKLKKLDLEPIVFDLLCTYIDSTDGLPLGYQTSQLFALLFLDEFDHFVKERLHIRWYGRYMDDFFLIHPDKDYLQFCLKEIRVFMASLGLELNEKTQIFPIRNGIDFLGFHTYLTEEGKVIRKLRHSSIKRMRSKLRRWEQDYPAGLVTREKILQSWQAWDAHAAHGNTWSLRQQVRDRVQNILKEEI